MKFFRKLRKRLPSDDAIQEHRLMNVFGDTLKQRDLWAFNRLSISKGAAIGVFCAFLPMPFEVVAAIFIAIMLRGNIPLAFAGVWISNPLTWVPLYTPCYLLGSFILRLEPIPLDEINILQLGWHYVALWLGCLIIGTTIALITLFTINLLWRLQVRQEWLERKERRRLKKLKKQNKNT